MIFQRISLATLEPFGEPGPLPYAVFGWPAELVADLSALDAAYELTDAGFWPVVDDVPEHDPATHVAVPGELVADPTNLRFVRSWSLEALPVPVPETISRRQFFEALWEEGHITFEEADAAVSGTIPAAMEGFLELLASFDERGSQKARLLIKSATTFERSNYVVPIFGSMYGMAAAQIDDLWRLAATL